MDLDWLTLRASVPPHNGKLWHGSWQRKRFECLERPDLRVAAGMMHGAYALEFTGDFFRKGGDYAQVVADVWGDPPPAMSAVRVDVAREWARNVVGACDVRAWAEAIALALPATRWGWGFREEKSEDGWTVYVGQRGQGQEGEPVLADMRARPLMLRCYQRTDGPMRVEAECKQMSGVAASEAISACFRLMAGLTGAGEWTVSQRTQVQRLGRKVPDGRAEPAKMLRQAWGLLRAADLRRNGRLECAGMERAWADCWMAVMGTEWSFAEERAARGVHAHSGWKEEGRLKDDTRGVKQGIEIRGRLGKFWSIAVADLGTEPDES